jgi:HD-GYP domain-containing protein (c-di-GMP phosphodiesterase class II)
MNSSLPTSAPPAAPKKHRRRASANGWPIKPSIASVVVVAMLVLAVLIIGIGWAGARQSMLDTASKAARDAGLLITEKTHRMLEPAQATLRLLTSDPLVEAVTLEQRLQRLHTLTDVLTSNELAAAIFVGYSDGSFMLVRPLDSSELRKRFEAPPQSNFLVQSIQVKADGSKLGEYLFYNAGRDLIERRARPDYQFDPRTRPWYQSASQTAASQASAPYVFFSTQQVGLTLSQSSADGRAIFGIDVVLDDLATSLTALKISPNTQLALIDSTNKVMAYPDMSKVLIKSADKFDFKGVDELGIPALAKLNVLAATPGKVATFDVDGTEWLGVVLPFNVWRTGDVRLLVAAPSDDLLGDLRAKGVRLIYWVIGISLLLMPFGWLAGATIGSSLDKLTIQAQRMSHFDFGKASSEPTLVQEANTLSEVMNEMGQTIQTFLQISQDMATEPKVERMLDNVLNQMVSATRCTAGAVYLCTEGSNNLHRAVTVGNLLMHPDQTMTYSPSGQGQTVRREVGQGILEMQVELSGRNGLLDGLLVLQHADDAGHADPSFTEFVLKLSGMLAVSIETRQLLQSQKNLLDAVIRLMADAIDAKSPYTGGHCERVPELAGMMVDRMTQETSGPYADFSLDEDQRYEFHLGAWLHDCGKVTSPEHIVDKATKLEVIYNRIHEIRMRFEVLWRDAEIEHLQRLAQGADAYQSKITLQARQQQLQEDFEFVAKCNVGGEFMADEAVQRLQSISSQGWQRQFDNRLGLSSEELKRLVAVEPQAPALPAQEQLLADRSDHIVAWGERKPAVTRDDPNNKHGFDMVLPPVRQNMGEFYNLSVRRGTLTDEDRFKINDHIVQTLIMLRSLPWPAHLARVPEIAATHHEKMDGKGYPRKLPGSQLTVPDRVMAMADIFEALTAADRPYKPAKTLTESLKIMAFMCKDQHIDTELFRYFLHSRIWHDFATRYMQPAQIDQVDLAAIEKILPAPAPTASA